MPWKHKVSPPNDITLQPGKVIVGEHIIPVDELNRAIPQFWGPAGTFPTVSYQDVLNGKVAPEFFKDKIVLIGATSPIVHDEYPTPYSTTNLVKSGALATPGVEIQASIIKTFLTDGWYRTVPPAVNVAFLFLVGLGTSLLVSGRGPWRGLLSALAVVAVVTGIVYLLWHAHWWLNLAAPLALIFLIYVVVTAADFIQAEMARRRTKAMFSRYVSPTVVEELMKNPDEVALGGSRKILTIMFCDIRGFTSYSENKEPEEVVQRLNEYLTAMTNVIFRHGGTLDKYLGDGLMAIFGAPVHYDDHIDRAIKAAVEIQSEVEKLNAKWASSNAQPLKIGIGINSGPVLVGNVGSPERMDYTVIGEDVNLASRTEGMTKHFGTLIVICERSVQALGEDSEFKEQVKYLGKADVKGFTEQIGFYTVPY